MPLLVGARHLLLTIDVSCLRGAQQRTRRRPLLRLNDGRQTVTYRPCFSCYASSVNKFSDHGITLPAAAFWRWRHIFRSIFGTRGTNSYRLHLSSEWGRTVSGIWLASAAHTLAAANQLHVDRRWLCAQSQARRKEMKWTWFLFYILLIWGGGAYALNAVPLPTGLRVSPTGHCDKKWCKGMSSHAMDLVLCANPSSWVWMFLLVPAHLCSTWTKGR